jgi:hypothetical protein
MQRRKLRAVTVAIGMAATAPLCIGDEIPPCEQTIRPLEVKPPTLIIERCRVDGEVRVAFIVNPDGRTSDIVIESVHANHGEQYNACLSMYATHFAQKLRYPPREEACRVSTPFHLKGD